MTNDTLKSFLNNNFLGHIVAEIKERDSRSHFSRYLPSDVSPLWPLLLYRFIHQTPWRYWDISVVETCLSILELNTQRTVAAIEKRSAKLGSGIENLLRRSNLADHEKQLSITNPRDLIKIATEYHSEYLRYAEHIFGKLIEIYWSILRKKSIEGKFDLRGAVTLIKSKGHDNILAGYVDDVRNAIAHGEVHFNGFNIRYGQKRENDFSNEYSAHEFLSAFDQLNRTSNALAIGIILFFARNSKELNNHNSLIIPSPIVTQLAAAGIELPGLEIIGSVESENDRVGRQLHIAMKSSFKARTIVMADALRLSAFLIQHGALNYNRFLIQIDYGKKVNSLIIILPEKLKILLDEDAPLARLKEAFDETPLLWFDESNLFRKIKTLKLLYASLKMLMVNELQRQRAQRGIKSWIGRYRIREIKKIGTSGTPKLSIRAVLLYPEDSENRDLMRKIIHAVIKKASVMYIKRSHSELKKSFPLPAHPKIVGVYLHKCDGTVRYLEGSGWFSGNLVAIGESVKGFKNRAIFVHKPEEIWKGIRLRYKSEMNEL